VVDKSSSFNILLNCYNLKDETEATFFKKNITSIMPLFVFIFFIKHNNKQSD